MMNASTNYSINPWMNPNRPGDRVDPTEDVAYGPENTLMSLYAQSPVPPSAGRPVRYGSGERVQPGIVEVLNIGPFTLMRDTPTRQESGMQGTLRPATGAW